MNKVERYLYLIMGLLGFIFLRSSIDKIEGGKFVGALAGTLGKFASKNPYPWYKSFLESVAIPNSVLFGNLTMWGEFFAGISLLGVSVILLFKKKVPKILYLVLILGLFVGAFLNVTFWFASSWTSPSTDGLNLVMSGVQIVCLIYFWQKYRAA